MFDADSGEVYTWGWKECVPSGKVFGDLSAGPSTEKEVLERQSSFMTEQGSFHLFKERSLFQFGCFFMTTGHVSAID